MKKHLALIYTLALSLFSSAAIADRLPGANTLLGQGLANPSPFKSLMVPNNGITNGMLAQVSSHTFKGNITGSTANVVDLTYAQVLTALGLGSADSPTHAGLTITGVAVNFTGLGTGTLADCAGFASASNVLIRNTCPSGGAGNPGGSANSLQTNVGGTSFGGISLTDGQLAVGQTGSAPLAKTVSGNATLSAGGVITIGGGQVSDPMLASTFLKINPALGTPVSGVATNLTGTAAGLTAGHVTTNADLTGPVTSTGNATAIANGALALSKLGGAINDDCIIGAGGIWTAGTCPGGGSGTVNVGTTPQAAYYATSAAAVSGASGVAFPNANSVSVGSPSGSAPGTGIVDVANGFQVNGVAIGQVVAGTSQTISAAQWKVGTTFVVTTAGQTLTLPASSTLSANGGIFIQTIGQTVALVPNGADTINAANATKTIGSGVTAVVTTNAAGAVYATPTAAEVPAQAGWIATVNPNKAVLYTADRALRISSIVGRVSDATGDVATVQVKKAASGTACSGGTALHSGTLDANGTSNTNQTLTLVGGATDDLAIGDSICLVTTGTTAWTTGTGIGGITVSMAPL